MRSFKSAFCLLLVLVVCCTKEEPFSRNYPRVNSNDVTQITDGGAVFNGEIFFASVPIIDHGFVWSTFANFDTEQADKISLGPKSGTGIFSAPCTYALKEGEKYYVRAFAKSEKNSVYGDLVTFVSRGGNTPVLLDFFPKEGSWDDKITLICKNLSTVERDLSVKFGAFSAFVVTSGSDTAIVTVPYDMNVKESQVSIAWEDITSTVTDKFVLKSPEITSISPASAITGTEVTINGQYLNGPKLKVTFGTAEATIKSIRKTQITCVVPAGIATGTIKVTVRTGDGMLTDDFDFNVLGPKIESVSPMTGAVGETMTITGKDLILPEGTPVVSFGNVGATILQATATSIKVLIPYSGVKDPIISVSDGSASGTFEGFAHRAPVVISYSPQRLTPGATITVTGKYFDEGTRLIIDGKLVSTNLLSSEVMEGPVPEVNNHGGLIELGFYYERISTGVITKFPWATIEPFPGDRFYQSVSFVHNGFGYIGLGGHGYQINNKFWQFNPSTAQWVGMADFPGAARVQANYFKVGNKAYVAAGYNNASSRLTDMYSYDFTTNVWSPLNGAPANMYPGACFTYANKGYVLSYNPSNGLSQLWKYEESNDSWSEVSTRAFEVGRGTNVYLNGTSVYFTWQGNMQHYNFSNNQWTDDGNVPSMNFGVTIGGVWYGGVIGKLYRFDVGTHSWIEDVPYHMQYEETAASFAFGSKGYFINGNTVCEFDTGL